MAEKNSVIVVCPCGTPLEVPVTVQQVLLAQGYSTPSSRHVEVSFNTTRITHDCESQHG